MDRRRFVMIAGLAAVTLPATIRAQSTTAPPRVRGTITGLSGDMLTVKARDGQTMTITLTEPLTVMAVKKAELSDIGPNSYVGTTTRTGADGRMTAVEIRIFPETMRGAGEGHRDWDLEPGSKMTNGTVTGAVAAASGREVTINHKDGVKTVLVAPNAGIMTYVPGTRADLKPGEIVVIAPMAGANGGLTANRVNVSRDGVAPMM